MNIFSNLIKYLDIAQYNQVDRISQIKAFINDKIGKTWVIFLKIFTNFSYRQITTRQIKPRLLSQARSLISENSYLFITSRSVRLYTQPLSSLKKKELIFLLKLLVATVNQKILMMIQYTSSRHQIKFTIHSEKDWKSFYEFK